MKIFLFLISILLTSVPVFAQGTTKQTQHIDSVYYTCVMHPEIHAAKPGMCPKCGMTLIKKIIKVEKQVPTKINNRPKSTSGSNTNKKAPPKIIVQQTDSVYYTCVMHPEIHSATPGKCPKCGMTLVKKTSKLNSPEQSKNNIDTTKTVHEETAIKKDNTKIINQQIEKENQKPGKAVIYNLFITDTIVNFAGKTRHAIAVNGSIPMPTLTFTEGDTAEIYVHNLLKSTTTLHWHGVILPNQFDGVPYLTQMPIKSGETHLYKFPVVQNGTYWYHSHSELQEQIGMYGVLIFLKKKEPPIKQYPIILSDWTNEKPCEVHRSLHNATDWYAIKKHSTQNYFVAIKEGYLKTKLTNEWKRMLAMDVSDVAYSKFLINGKPTEEQPQFKAGDKVKLRIVNGGAATYFWLSYSGGKMTVVANDGEDVEPVEVDRLIIAVAETYDVIVTIPENMSYEFLATAEDRTKSASLWLGSGMKMPATPFPKLKYFEGMKMMNGMMKMNGNLDDMGMKMSNQVMDMNSVMYPESTGEQKTGKKKSKSQEGKMKMVNMQMNDSGYAKEGDQHEIITLNYGMLRAVKKTTLPVGTLKELHFVLTGNMNRFVWSMDNKTVSEADKILIHKGENIRVILTNNTMMRHPMHLHGHFFRLLNGQGDYAPLKNVLDIMPMETDTFEFAATESGDWFFHCHLLYHMMSGMGRIFSYENSPPNPELPNPKQAQRKLFSDDREFHPMAKIGIENNGSDGEAMLANTRWKLETMWHLGYHDEHGYESETMLGRYHGKKQWWYPYAGFDYHYRKVGNNEMGNIFGTDTYNAFGQLSNKNDRQAFVVGIQYTLPMLVIADARFDSDGKFRFQLSRQDIPVTSRLRLNLMANTDKEYMAGFRYIVTKYFSLSTHYDSDMGLGAGITFTY